MNSRERRRLQRKRKRALQGARPNFVVRDDLTGGTPSGVVFKEYAPIDKYQLEEMKRLAEQIKRVPFHGKR